MHMAWLALGGMLCSLQLSTGSFPRPLSPKEERHYLERAAQGDTEARNILIERNLRLVAHIMKKYYAAESDQEDLISIGTIGLIKAVSSYRLDKNIRLATYASRCIENAILSQRTNRPAPFGAGRLFRDGYAAGAGLSVTSRSPGTDMRWWRCCSGRCCCRRSADSKSRPSRGCC
ncbi:MAG: sigma-70 family RNA polymerase sigma factor [Ruminococcaceae bacterium]|nr:sigma-70 family RNA polymerase sigma factor [Oscillospiraceae bacterium]